MSPVRIVLVGAGPHAAVVAEAVQALGGFDIVGLTDPSVGVPAVIGLPVLGGDELLPSLRSEDVRAAVICVGDNALRQRLAARVRALGFELPAIVHPSALVAPSARVEDGAVVMARAVVGTRSVVKELAIVNTGAVIDHDCVIGTAAHVAPGSALAGTVKVGDRALIGVGSAILPEVEVGADALVAAGSAVARNVGDGERVGGVPARGLPSRIAPKA